MADKREVREVWNLLCINYPHYVKDLPAPQIKQTIQLWERLMADIPAEALKAAVLAHIDNNRYFPSVSELTQPAKRLAMPAQLTALEAWGKVVDSFASGEYYFFESGHASTPTFDPLTQHILDAMGGYWNVARSENQIADRARFIEAYDQIARRQEADRLMLPEVRAVREKLLAQAVAPVVKALSGGNNHGDDRD